MCEEQSEAGSQHELQAIRRDQVCSCSNNTSVFKGLMDTLCDGEHSDVETFKSPKDQGHIHSEHPGQVKVNLSYGFFPSTSHLENSLPSSVFPASFNLPSFKRDQMA